MNKKKFPINGIVYSTDPSFVLNSIEEEVVTLIPENQQLKILLDTKQRAGKAVTLINGFIGTSIDLEKLGKLLKTYCGTGGSIKDGVIIIQGDQREKIKQWLLKNGYKKTK